MASRISWARVTVEGAVIVVSILLAFGIDAWWDERQDRREEQEALTALRAEFEALDADFQVMLPFHRILSDGVESLVSLGGSPDRQLSVAQVDSAFRAALSAPTLDPGRGTLDALLSSGRIELIRDAELQAALTAWGRRIEEIRDGQLVIRDFVRETLVPYLAEEGVPLTRAYRALDPDRPSSSLPMEATTASYARVLSDVRFRSLLSYRLEWAEGTVDAYERAADLLDHILALIEDNTR